MLSRQERDMIDQAVAQMAREWLWRVEPARNANPNRRLIELAANAQFPWFTSALISETKAIKKLTIVLIAVTTVLALLTLRLIIG